MRRRLLVSIAVMATLLDKMLFPGVIGTSPQTSRLVLKGTHAGPAFQDDDKKTVSDWISLYNAQLTAPKLDDMGNPIPPMEPLPKPKLKLTQIGA